MIAALIATLFAFLPASHVPVGTPVPGCTVTINGDTFGLASGQLGTYPGPVVVMCRFGMIYIQTKP